VQRRRESPTVFLEFDAIDPIGPFRIRMEAFLEMPMNQGAMGGCEARTRGARLGRKR